MSASIVIQNGILVSPKHPLHGTLVSIRCENGIIQEISTDLLHGNETIDAQSGFISTGWCDSYSVIPDPGAEWKEGLASFAHASALAGFTQSAVFAGVDPLPEKANAITALKQRSLDLAVEILPLGAASEACEGKEMAEVYDMHKAGAVAQTDGMHAHGSDGLRTKLLEYCKSLNIPYLIHPYNPKWVAGGQIHEGQVSVNLGLKGIPTIAETSALLADIELAKWLNAPLRVLGVSTHEAVEIIKRARLDGVEIWASVSVMNLCFSEEEIGNFDERFKVLPPLRSSVDMKALRDAVIKGDIQAICSNHTPEDIENQKVEFDYAGFGAASLSGFIPRLLQTFSDQELPMIIEALTEGNRGFLNLANVEIAVGEPAHITVISRNVEDTSYDFGSIAYNKLPHLHGRGGLICTLRGSELFKP